MPLVIPVFIPHQGCPHCCIFCNQYRISGQGREEQITSSNDVVRLIEKWLNRSSTADKEVQVAFYGGSFTGIEPARQEELLDAVAPFIKRGDVRDIRLSTRPDYIDRKTVTFLKKKHVGIVELGVQSLDNDVLRASNRGHTAEHSVKAVRMLKEGEMKVGIQLMLGLPRQTRQSLMQTVKDVAGLQPDFVRIYPVLVLKGSMLADMYEQGGYTPLSLDVAVVLAAKMKEHFDGCGIKIIRMGLQSGPDLEKSLLAGPYHPAFGEMVGSRIMLKNTRKILQGIPEGEKIILGINDRDQSLFRGIRSSNIRRLSQLKLVDRFILRTDANLPRFMVHKISTNNSET